jgi:hypothetical protein
MAKFETAFTKNGGQLICECECECCRMLFPDCTPEYLCLLSFLVNTVSKSAMAELTAKS